MRSSLLLLPGHAVGEALCAVAEEVLTDVAVAFNHSFLIRRDKIGVSSVRAYDTPLTEETVDACEQADAVLLGDTNVAGAEDLLQSLDIPCKTRTFSLKDARRFYIVQTVSLDIKTLGDAVQYAYELAKTEELPLSYVSPSGKAAMDFKAAVHVRERDYASVITTELLPPKAVNKLLYSPEKVGVFVVPPYAGSMLNTMATAVYGASMMLFDACESRKHFVYAPVVSEDAKADDALNPIGMVLASAQLLRDALHLEREADCVDAAVRNVLAAGWRTPDMAGGSEAISGRQILRLILDQIELAGELLSPQGGNR